MFGGVNSAASVGERNYFNGGDYLVEVLTFEARSGFKGDNAIARFRIVEVLQDYPSDASYAASNRAGEIVSVVYPLSAGRHRDFHLGRLRQLAETILGPVEDLETALAAASAPPGTTWAGVRLRATGTRSRKADKAPIVNVSFAPVSE
jgi:hypothetical protein